MILTDILAAKEQQLNQAKAEFSFKQLTAQLEKTNLDVTYDFIQAIQANPGLSIIAELKKASPSKGLIRKDFHPVKIAEELVKHKVAALSVLTEEKFFQGSHKSLVQIRAAVKLPLLCKDFFIDTYQVLEARLLGADCILLITSALSQSKLNELFKLASDLSLHCLVEVHDRSELAMALEMGATLIGINNRNLTTFQTNLDTTENLIKYIPRQIIVISESGIHTRADMIRLEQLGIDGVLIGESLMSAVSIANKLRELRGDTCG